MKILALDDEKVMLKLLVNCIVGANPEADLYPFSSVTEAVDFVEQNQIDVAFLEIKLKGGMSGLEVAQKFMDKNPKINIIFVTCSSEHGLDAMKLHASGYIEKPVTVNAVVDELNNLRFPLPTKSKRIRFQCFGNFEVYVDEQPLTFSNTKTKELLAYLVDRRGSMCTTREIMGVLWEDGKTHDSYFKKIRRDLIQTLEDLQCLDVLFIQRGRLAINVKMVHCDYYEWRKKEPKENYVEEYMSQYSWGQYRTGF